MAGSADIQTMPGGWSASLDLGFQVRDQRTCLTRRRQRGPLAVQRSFYPEGPVCHTYILHPPGGVVGGDRLDLRVESGPGARALLTTPGATKFYRSAGPLARVEQSLRVAAGATLEWLPQENICFVDARVRSRTRVDLGADARHCGWEIYCLGRPAIDERFAVGELDASLSIDRGGRPLLRERLRLDGACLDDASGLRGQPVVASLWATPAGPRLLEAVRDLAPAPGLSVGATLLDDLLVVRAIGADGDAVRRLLVQAWQRYREVSLGTAACAPRIWAT